MKKVAVFCSGSGSNFQSLIDAVNRKELEASLILVASKPEIHAVTRAISNQLPYYIFNTSEYASQEEMYRELAIFLKSIKIDLIVLSGYLSILTPNFIKAFENKIINIHPSLLPKFGGLGFHGIKVHEAVIAANETVSGCTVHFVDEAIDKGKVIAIREVPVFSDDTPEVLKQRVFSAENTLLPQVVDQLLTRRKK